MRPTVVKIQPMGYAELKEAQLEQRDAEHFGSTVRPAPMPDLTEIERQIQAQDSRLGQWFGNSTKGGCQFSPNGLNEVVAC